VPRSVWGDIRDNLKDGQEVKSRKSRNLFTRRNRAQQKAPPERGLGLALTADLLPAVEESAVHRMSLPLVVRRALQFMGLAE